MLYEMKVAPVFDAFLPTRKLVQAEALMAASAKRQNRILFMFCFEGVVVCCTGLGAGEVEMPCTGAKNLLTGLFLCKGHTALNDMSSPLTEWVRAPNEMKSTPACA